jgi:hypothetical protein
MSKSRSVHRLSAEWRRDPAYLAEYEALGNEFAIGEPMGQADSASVQALRSSGSFTLTETAPERPSRPPASRRRRARS